MYTQIHETVIRDIVDVISDVKNADELKGFRNKDRSFKSIAKASSNLTLVFPVPVSKNMSIENAGMVAKAIERKATTMLQLLFSAMNISDAENGIEYIKNFHTNLKVDNDINVDDFIDLMDKYVVEHESTIQFNDRALYEAVMQDLKNINFVLPDSLNESGLNEFKVYPESVYGQSRIVNEGETKTTINTKTVNLQATDQWGNLLVDKSGKPIIAGSQSDTTTIVTSPDPDRSKDDWDKAKIAADIAGKKNDLLRNQILDTDIKKANELVPTMMIVNFTNASLPGTPVQDQMIIGVKAKMYTLDSSDIINRLSLKHQDNHRLLKFIKATTREISFVKDFLFAIDAARIDALSQSKKGSSSKLWKVLERRSKKSKIRRSLGQVNDASAISTLVVSQEEVEYLKKVENLNIEDPKVIRPIMESYNLMGFCIVDETMEVAKFIFDTGDDIYETLSFTLLERETSDNGYKKVINLMTKMAR